LNKYKYGKAVYKYFLLCINCIPNLLVYNKYKQCIQMVLIPIYVVYTIAYKDFLYAINYSSKQCSYLLHMIMYKQIQYTNIYYTVLLYFMDKVDFIFSIEGRQNLNKIWKWKGYIYNILF